MIKTEGEMIVWLSEMLALCEIIGCLKQMDNFPPYYLTTLTNLKDKILAALMG